MLCWLPLKSPNSKEIAVVDKNNRDDSNPDSALSEIILLKNDLRWIIHLNLTYFHMVLNQSNLDFVVQKICSIFDGLNILFWTGLNMGDLQGKEWEDFMLGYKSDFRKREQSRSSLLYFLIWGEF